MLRYKTRAEEAMTMTSSNAEAVYCAGFGCQDLEKLVSTLGRTKSGKTLKALHVGPPVDGTFSEESHAASAGLERYFKESCSELLVVWGWDLTPALPEGGAAWSWRQLESGAMQGSDLGQ